MIGTHGYVEKAASFLSRNALPEEERFACVLNDSVVINIDGTY